MGGPRGAEPPQHFHWQNFFHPQERGYRVRLRHISMGAHLRQYPYTALFQAYSDALLLSSAIKLPRLPAAAVACSRTPLIQLILGLPRFLGPAGSTVNKWRVNGLSGGAPRPPGSPWSDGRLVAPGGLPPPWTPRLESLRSRNGVASLRKWSRFAPGWKILHIFDGNPIGEYIMRGGLRPPLTTWWRAHLFFFRLWFQHVLLAF